MRSKTTLVLLVVTLLLGVFIWFFERKVDPAEQRAERARSALRIHPESITYIRFRTDELDIECEKEEGAWLVTQPVRARADGGTIERALWGMQRLSRGDVITAAEQEQQALTTADYGLGEPRVRITLGDERVRRTFLVGDETALGEQLFIKEESQADIIVTDAALQELIPETLEEIRDRNLFAGTPYEVNRFEIRRREGFLQVVRRENGAWELQQPLVARADATACRKLLEALFDLEVEAFVTDELADPAAYGLDDSPLQVSIWLERDNEAQTLFLGNRLEGEEERIYAKNDAFESVYLVSAAIVERLGLRVEELRDRRLLPWGSHEIAGVRFLEGERAIELAKRDAEWELVKPVQQKADNEQVNAMLQGWADARIERFVGDAVTNEEALGFSAPYTAVVMARAPLSNPASTEEAGTSPEVETWTALLERASNQSPQRVWVKGSGSLYEVNETLREWVSLDPLSFRDRQVLRVGAEGIRFISLEWPEREQTIVRNETGTFVPETSENAVVDKDAVADILSVVGGLRAVRFVAANPESLEPFGLEEPRVMLTLGLSGESGIEKALLLGKRNEDGYVYATIRGEDVVFLLEEAVRRMLTRDLYAVVPAPGE